jgi:hypothetical protein
MKKSVVANFPSEAMWKVILSGGWSPERKEILRRLRAARGEKVQVAKMMGYCPDFSTQILSVMNVVFRIRNIKCKIVLTDATIPWLENSLIIICW